MSESIEGLYPRLIAEAGQDHLEEIRAEIDERIAFFQLKIDLEADNNETLQKIANEAILELDQSWPFHGQLMLVSGKIVTPKTAEAGTLSYVPTEEEALVVKPSDGFGVAIVEGKPQIGYLFKHQQHIIRTPMMRGGFDLYSFALPKNISLDFIGAPNEEMSESLPVQILDAIDYYDNLWRLHLEKSNFLSASHKKQKLFIDSFIDGANEVIGWPENNILVSISADRSYVRTVIDTPYGFKTLLPDADSESIELIGGVSGVTLLEREVVDKMPLRSASDFIDIDAGLCLAINPSAGNIRSEDAEEHHILVPISAIDELEIEAN